MYSNFFKEILGILFRFHFESICSSLKNEDQFYEVIMNLNEATFGIPIIVIESYKNDADVCYRVLLGSRANIVHCFAVRCLN